MIASKAVWTRRDPREGPAVALSSHITRRVALYFAGALLVLIAAPAGAGAQTDHWQVGTAPSLSSGKYGTDARTDVLYTPITARRLFENGDIALIFPMTCIKGNGGVTVVNGSPVRTDQTRGGSPTGGASGRLGAGDSSRRGTDSGRGTDTGVGTTAIAPTASLTTCGMGDISVRGRYYVLDERGWLPTIAVRGHVKAPTANGERGLGTGRPDEGVGLEVSRSIGGGLMAMVDGGYTIIGQPDGIEFNNTWWYDIGLGQSIAGGLVDLSAFFEEYQSIVPGLSGSREVLAALSLKVPGGWRLQVTGEAGLSDGAPDHGVTFGASRRF